MGTIAEDRGNAPAQARSPDTRDLFRRLEVVLSPAATVAENLAIDEEMIRAAAPEQRTALRLWWGDAPTVVVGNSEKPEVVADLVACERLGIPVVRRRTGGGTVLQTADVVNYSLTAPAPVGLDVRAAFAIGARVLVGALARLGLRAEMRGISDVVVGDRKISGNAQARRRGGLLVHGTLLVEVDLGLLEACLRHPPREPDYRRGRGHRDFLTSLRREGVPATPAEVEDALIAAAEDLARE
ncbi:MAG: lipoate--protein ligase family protein [Chloroflexota bacterium]